MSNLDVITEKEHLIKMFEKLSPLLSIVCTQHKNLTFCILRVDPENAFF